jgi:hypothetical protein
MVRTGPRGVSKVLEEVVKVKLEEVALKVEVEANERRPCRAPRKTRRVIVCLPTHASVTW